MFRISWLDYVEEGLLVCGASFERAPAPYIVKEGASCGSSGTRDAENSEGMYSPLYDSSDIWQPHLYHWQMSTFCPFWGPFAVEA